MEERRHRMEGVNELESADSAGIIPDVLVNDFMRKLGKRPASKGGV